MSDKPKRAWYNYPAKVYDTYETVHKDLFDPVPKRVPLEPPGSRVTSNARDRANMVADDLARSQDKFNPTLGYPGEGPRMRRGPATKRKKAKKQAKRPRRVKTKSNRVRTTKRASGTGHNALFSDRRSAFSTSRNIFSSELGQPGIRVTTKQPYTNVTVTASTIGMVTMNFARLLNTTQAYLDPQDLQSMIMSSAQYYEYYAIREITMEYVCAVGDDATGTFCMAICEDPNSIAASFANARLCETSVVFPLRTPVQRLTKRYSGTRLFRVTRDTATPAGIESSIQHGFAFHADQPLTALVGNIGFINVYATVDFFGRASYRALTITDPRFQEKKVPDEDKPQESPAATQRPDTPRPSEKDSKDYKRSAEHSDDEWSEAGRTQLRRTSRK